MDEAPIAWIVKWTQKSIPPEHVSAYIKEDDARRAAANVERYADASNVVVIPAFART